ncbi:MAG TPA: Mrp/NBP35 family ATP-binding protein [Candidatus Desulfovibrio intestinipullorum]|uniref:Iron-sulfur cluster carrier protein n=1 Tax=Candidatus Desulfovibrio intestinipullorum TaxID=2838536 RepID=A0A9D1PXF1_9BACT|nr:Mrp/NBP35 family ATP-binding protein [Candidatus Desulfovibrio intestinipullorum]
MAECSHCGSASSCSSAGTNGPCPSQMIAQQDKQIEDRLSHIKHKIFVMSGKGGVGKSSVAVNVACALVKLGYKVGLLDVDIHGPSVPNLLGMKSTNLMVNEQGLIIPAMWQDKMEVISMDTLLGEDRDQAIIWRGPKKTGAIRQFISDVAWGNLDFLVIDSPPGTGDEHMTILQAIPDATCLIVTTPQEISLADVRKAINFIQITHAKTVGLVENMSGVVCPHCHKTFNPFKQGGGKKLAEQDKIPFLGAIPLDVQAVVSADNGVPIVTIEEESPAKDAFIEITKNMVAELDKAK